jgi:hypothetical protein
VSAGSCPQCGTPRQGSLRYCPNCSFDYWKAAAGEAQPGTPPSEAPSQHDGTGRGSAFWIGAGVAALVLLLVGYAYIQNTVENIYQNVGNALSSDLEAAEQVARTQRPTAAPTEIPLAQFAPIELAGRGNAVPRFSIPEDAAAIATISHQGSANFAVWSVGSDGAEQDLLVNVIGNYAGTVLFDEQTDMHSVALRVDADGAWTITIKPVSEAFHWDQAATAGGIGDDVVIVDPPTSGLKTVTIIHNGSANFAVWAYASSGTDLLVNEIGPYSGESLLGDGTFLIEIAADGSWSISPPE